MLVFHVKNYGDIKIELDFDNAPNTAANFLDLARRGFYNGLTFHRIIKGFMIQGGDPKGNGLGGPGYSIKGEFRLNNFDNKLKHERGIISMARSYDYNSAGSQFFIMHKDAPYLDGQYAAFGKVVDGMNIVDRIAGVKTNNNDMPLSQVVIEKIEVIDEKPRPVERIYSKKVN